jgi:hypothetical protein
MREPQTPCAWHLRTAKEFRAGDSKMLIEKVN